MSDFHYRMARSGDVPLLARLNRQLIEDEGHRNTGMTVEQLEERMRGFLEGAYEAVLFERDEEVVAYELHRDDGESIYLRQLFVQRDCRREGIGRRVVQLLGEEVWPMEKRIAVEVLMHNETGLAFWRSVGFEEYCMTLEMPPVREDSERS